MKAPKPKKPKAIADMPGSAPAKEDIIKVAIARRFRGKKTFYDMLFTYIYYISIYIYISLSLCIYI